MKAEAMRGCVTACASPQTKATVQVPNIDPKQAGETYEKRMQATDELLQHGRLDL